MVNDYHAMQRRVSAEPRSVHVRFALCVAALAITTLAIFAFPLLEGKLYLNNDLGQFHIPVRHFYAQCLKNGENFTWMPSILCGYYVHGEGQAGMYHPLHLLLYRFLPFTWAFNLDLLLPYPFMFAGMLLFLRRWGLPAFAVLFGAFAFTFSGFNLLHYFHMNMIAVVAHIPWLMFAIDVALRANNYRTVYRACLGIALLTASQLLYGFPQAVMFSLIAEGTYAAALLIALPRHTRQSSPHHRPLRWVKCVWLVSAKMFALLLAAVQLLPSLDLLADTVRANAGPGFRYFFSLYPANLLQLIGPYFFQGYIGMNDQGPKQPQEAGLYLGAVGILWIVWCVIRRHAVRRESRANPGNDEPAPSLTVLVYASLALGAIGLTLALGKYTPFYRLVSHLPIVASFRSPCRHLVLFYLAASCLAAIAVADLARTLHFPEPPRWKSLWPLFIPMCAGWIAAAILLAARADVLHPIFQSLVPRPLPDFLTSNKEILLNPVLMSVATGFFLIVVRARSAFALALLLLCAGADQAFYGLRLVNQEHPLDFATLVAHVDTPPTANNYRVYALLNNFITLRGARNCGGYAGMELRRALHCDYFKPGTLRAAGVRWANNDWPRLGQNLTWRAVPNPVPMVHLVSQTRVTQDPAQALETTDLRTTALVPTPVSLVPGPPGAVSIRTYQPGLIALDARNTTRQLLVIAESFYPGWRATVDAVPHPIMRVNGDFMGCILQPGSHHVTLTFAPDSLRRGKILSTLGLILLALVGLPAMIFRRKPA